MLTCFAIENQLLGKLRVGEGVQLSVDCDTSTLGLLITSVMVGEGVQLSVDCDPMVPFTSQIPSP